MGKTTLTALVAAALVGLTVLTMAAPAEAGRGGYGRYHGGGGGRYVQNNYYRGGGGNALGAGLIGFGVGAIVGSALTPREVYVAPPPPPARDLLRPGRLRADALVARTGTATAIRATGASIRTPARLSATTATSASAASLTSNVASGPSDRLIGRLAGRCMQSTLPRHDACAETDKRLRSNLPKLRF